MMPPTVAPTATHPRLEARHAVAPRPPAAPAQPPVFVDPTGRRRRLVGRATVAALLSVSGLVAVTVGSIASDAGAPVEWQPTSTAHVTPLGR